MRTSINTKPLSQTWTWLGWLPLFLLTGLIAIPPGFIFGPLFIRTNGPFASIPHLTWYKTFIWSLDVLTPLITLVLLWVFERVRGLFGSSPQGGLTHAHLIAEFVFSDEAVNLML